jgi:hypothetical protein
LLQLSDSLMIWNNKLECLSLATFSGQAKLEELDPLRALNYKGPGFTRKYKLTKESTGVVHLSSAPL